MNRKKSLVVLVGTLALFTVTAVLAGCAEVSTWWQNFQSNPVAQVTTFEQGAQVALSGAQVAFNLLLPRLAPADQAQAMTDFNNALATVNHALVALNDAVTAAADAKQANPDFSGAMAAVTDAVNQVIAIVDQYTAKATIPASSLPGLEDAKASAKHLTRWRTHP